MLSCLLGPFGLCLQPSRVVLHPVQVWDYIFLEGPEPQHSKIPGQALQAMRQEFNFWYPFDLRVSLPSYLRKTPFTYRYGTPWLIISFLHLGVWDAQDSQFDSVLHLSKSLSAWSDPFDLLVRTPRTTAKLL